VSQSVDINKHHGAFYFSTKFINTKDAEFCIVDIETNAVEVIPNISEHTGGTGVPPEYIAPTGTHIMLCSGLGPKAVTMFEQYGIDVFVGASGTVQDAVTAWQKGLVSEATDENACSENRHE